MRLVHSGEAVADLVRFHAFIARHDLVAARRIAATLKARIESLLEFPDIGRPVPQAPEPGTIRDLVAGRYIVRYTAQGNAIAILRIWHRLETEP